MTAGLRAQLKSGSLLTGQLLVALDMHQDAAPAQIVWNEPYPEFPTDPDAARGDRGNIVSQIARSSSKMPLDEIGASLRRRSTRSTPRSAQAERTLASATDLVGARARR